MARGCNFADEILRAEFPQFETAQSFGVLRLKTRHEERELASMEAERNKHIEQLSKIAQMLELDVHDVPAQYYQHLPTAQRA